MGLSYRLTETLRFVRGVNNASGDGARLPTWELIVAADELEELGLVEKRPRGRYLTPAGLAAIAEGEG